VGQRAALGGGLKRVAPWLLGGLALLAVFFGMLPSEDDYRGIPASSRSASPSGAKALYRFFGAVGLEVRRWESRDYQGLPDGTLWILNRTPVPHLRIDGLREFLGRGNTIIGSFEALEPLLEAEGLGGLSKDLAETSRVHLPGDKELDSSDAHGIGGDPEPDRVFATGSRRKNDTRNVIAGWHAGDGEIVILGADDIVRNDEVGLAENGPFLLQLARTAGREGHRPPSHVSAPGHPQIFDEVSTGVATKSFAQLLAELPYRYGLLEAALALLVLLLGALPRRAPVDPVPAHRRRTTVEHLDAVARLWGLTGDPGLPLAELLAHVNERSRRFLHDRGAEGAAPFADWVRRRRADLADRAAAAVHRAELLAAGRPPAAAAQAAAAELIALEGEASRW
jgi:hypothetical protein